MCSPPGWLSNKNHPLLDVAVQLVLCGVTQALMVLRHFPDTWLNFAAWHTRVGGAKSAPAAIEVLTRAVKVRSD